MKTYSQMAEDVFSRRDEYEASQKKKKKTAQRTTVSVGCCIVAAICIGVYHNSPKDQFNLGNSVTTVDSTQPSPGIHVVPNHEKETTAAQGAIPVKPDITTNNMPEEEKTTAKVVVQPSEPIDSDRVFCYLNKITGNMAAHPLYRDPALHYTEEYSDTESAEYYGIDLAKLSACMPEGMTMRDGAHKKIFENSGTLVEERSEFVFKGDDSKAVYIRANRLGPVSDCLYMSDSDLSTTFMTKENGEVKVKVFFAEDAEEMFGCKTLIVADFTVNGVNYRITTENLNLKREFRPILEEMIGLY